MDPEEIFKKFFFPPFEDYDQRRFGDGNGSRSRNHHSEPDMFGDWHRQMHQQMEEMDRQMMDVFRIFKIPDLHSALPRPSEKHQHQFEGKPRDHMLKDEDAGTSVQERKEPSLFSSPHRGGIFSKWFESFPKLPQVDRVHPEDMRDSDLDGKKPNSEQIADLLTKKGDSSPQHPGQMSLFPGFSFYGNSVKIQTIVGKDGMIEEKRTVRDSSGREETTVTRKIGDSSHVVTTITDGQGQEEKHEVFNSLDKDKIIDFDKHWADTREGTGSSKSLNQVPMPRNGVLSDDTRGIFRKFFGW